MEVRLGLRLPRDAASVPLARHLCGDTLRKLEVDPDCVSDVEIAITEACTNVVKHSLDPYEEYTVSVAIDGKTCAISVSDAGRGFDHESHGADTPHAIAEGGRGIVLMRALVDNVRFISRPADGTIVHLVKTLRLAEGSIPHQLITH